MVSTDLSARPWLTHEELHAEVVDALGVDLLEVLLRIVPALNQAVAHAVGYGLHPTKTQPLTQQDRTSTRHLFAGWVDVLGNCSRLESYASNWCQQGRTLPNCRSVVQDGAKSPLAKKS